MKAGASGSITLDELIKNDFQIEGRRLTDLENLEIAKQIASITQESHSQDQVNFNFSPSNFDISVDANEITVQPNQNFSRNQKKQSEIKELRVGSITSLRQTDPDYVPPEYIHPAKQNANDTYNIMYFDKADIWRMGKLFEKLNLPNNLTQPMLKEDSSMRSDAKVVLEKIFKTIVTIENENADAVKQESENTKILEMVEISGKLTKLKDQLLDNISQNQDTQNFASELDSILDELNPYLASENVRIKKYAQAIKDDPFGVDNIIDFYGYYEDISAPDKLFDLEQNAIIFSNESNLNLLRFSKEQKEKLTKAIQPALTVALAEQEAELKEAEAQRVAAEEAALEQHKKQLAANIAPAAANRAKEIILEREKAEEKAAAEARNIAEKEAVSKMKGPEYVLHLMNKYEPGEKNKVLHSFVVKMIEKDPGLGMNLYNQAANAMRKPHVPVKTIAEHIMDFAEDYALIERLSETGQTVHEIGMNTVYDQRVTISNKIEAVKAKILNPEAEVLDPEFKAALEAKNALSETMKLEGNATIAFEMPNSHKITAVSDDEFKQIVEQDRLRELKAKNAVDINSILNKIHNFNGDTNAVDQQYTNIPHGLHELKKGIANKGSPDNRKAIESLATVILINRDQEHKLFLNVLKDPLEAESLVHLINENRKAETEKLEEIEKLMPGSISSLVNYNFSDEITKFKEHIHFNPSIIKNISDQKQAINGVISQNYKTHNNRTPINDMQELVTNSRSDNVVRLSYAQKHYLPELNTYVQQHPDLARARQELAAQLKELDQKRQALEDKEISLRGSVAETDANIKQGAESFLSLWQTSKKDTRPDDTNAPQNYLDSLLDDYIKLCELYTDFANELDDNNPNKIQVNQKLNEVKEKISEIKTNLHEPSTLSNAISYFTSALSALKELATACFPGARKEKEIHKAADELGGHPKESKESKPPRPKPNK
jgi:hypothetical protein